MAHLIPPDPQPPGQPDPTRLGKRLERLSRQLADDPQIRATLEQFVADTTTRKLDDQVAALSARLDAVAAKATGRPT